MGRKSKEIALQDRGVSKTFLITEMPAMQAEAWGMRALGAMARSGVEFPPDFLGLGMLGFRLLGLRAFLAAPWSDVEPLLGEIMACVKIVPAKLPEGRPLTPDDIEDIGVIVQLREEVLEIHLGFKIAADLMEAVAAASMIQGYSTTRTSAEPAAPSSAPN